MSEDRVEGFALAQRAGVALTMHDWMMFSPEDRAAWILARERPPAEPVDLRALAREAARGE